MKRILQGISFLLVFTLVGYGTIWCLDPHHFPLTTVKFIGERRYLSEKALQNAVLSEAQKGFFRLRVSSLQRELLLLTWVKQVEVRRVWPNQLVIRFAEHFPAAFWNGKGVFSAEGFLFYPEALTLKRERFSLPVLKGPEDKSALVWQQFLVMKETLSPLHLEIQQLVLAPRGAWHLRLSNGIIVVLGTDDIHTRLNRFVHIYNKKLVSREKEIAYVDLRYTSGMAVGWRSG